MINVIEMSQIKNICLTNLEAKSGECFWSIAKLTKTFLIFSDI